MSVITGITVIKFVSGALGFAFAHYWLGGKGMGYRKDEDDKSKERWPFSNEKLIGEKPFVEVPVPEYPVWYNERNTQ